MRASLLRFLTMAGLLLLAAGPGKAHHSFAAIFDREDPVNLTGTVTKVEWGNPHTWFYIDVENDDGDVENWAFELGSSNHLLRRGWNRNSLQVGHVVTVVGSRERAGGLIAAARTLTLSTGESLFGAQDESQ